MSLKEVQENQALMLNGILLVYADRVNVWSVIEGTRALKEEDTIQYTSVRFT
jgi:hypothetical protein